MSLTRKQFDVLEKMATQTDSYTQRDLERLTGHSLGTINRVIKELTDPDLFQMAQSLKQE